MRVLSLEPSLGPFHLLHNIQNYNFVSKLDIPKLSSSQSRNDNPFPRVSDTLNFHTAFDLFDSVKYRIGQNTGFGFERNQICVQANQTRLRWICVHSTHAPLRAQRTHLYAQWLLPFAVSDKYCDQRYNLHALPTFQNCLNISHWYGGAPRFSGERGAQCTLTRRRLILNCVVTGTASSRVKLIYLQVCAVHGLQFSTECPHIFG
ncbi:Hypothetical_protein [Hexamita inflata]|uniref:Hypothetical_protein n=1 Tax=Hexamita inflata TaxID=28002 RepID=A0AA86QSX3_9EUKA|nr:Hypothetical protein HINF_LOCUS48596 [Hexamita inflata]